MSSPSRYPQPGTLEGPSAHAQEPTPGAPFQAARELDVGTIYSQHADAVARWAARLLGPTHDIEDVVHEVFLIACRRLNEFRGDAKITTWLYEIAVRVAQERRRTQRRTWWLFGRAAAREFRSEAGGTDETARIPADQPSALELLERKEAAGTLYEILDGLSEKYRTTIILFELEGLSGHEIAAITKTSLSNVWIRLHRGRQQFLKRLLAYEAKGTP